MSDVKQRRAGVYEVNSRYTVPEFRFISTKIYLPTELSAPTHTSPRLGTN